MYLLTALAIKACVCDSSGERGEQAHLQNDTDSYLDVGSIHLLFLFYLQALNTMANLKYFNSGINRLSILYRRNGVHFTFWDKNGTKNGYIWNHWILYVNALHNHWFWFDIWRSPLIAQNTHNAVTTLCFDWGKDTKEQDRHKQDFVDLRSLLQLAVIENHWVERWSAWRDVAAPQCFYFTGRL